MHLQREIEKLKKRILILGALVEQRVDQAVRSVLERDMDLGQRVVEGDREVDEAEVDVEEECLQILALYQPVATDLRFIITVLKLNNDLERIGDLAVNIAQRSRRIVELGNAIESPFDFRGMATRVQSMLRRSLQALVNSDTELARQVCADDQAVDDLHREVYALVQERIKKDPARTDALIPWITLSRHLERIADHATNIAEDVLYSVEGRIRRHHL